MLINKLKKFKTVELSWVMLVLGLVLPYFKYNFNLPNYFDFIYLVYFIYIVIAKSDTREPVVGALILLVITPFLLMRSLENFAELTAIGAFYLLVVSVFALLVKFISENRKNIVISENVMDSKITQDESINDIKKNKKENSVEIREEKNDVIINEKESDVKINESKNNVILNEKEYNIKISEEKKDVEIKN